MFKKRTRIGIDFGGVIAPLIHKTSNEDTSLFENKRQNKNAFDSIHKLIKKYKKKNIFIVSKAGENMQKMSTKWLIDNNFFKETKFRKKT